MRRLIRTEHYDVVVVGGGPAGVCAAVASARRGLNTLLVEQYGFLGGMATTAYFQPWRGFHSYGKQIVNGIAQEIVGRLQNMNGSPGHVIDPGGVSFSVTPFDPEMLKYVLQEFLLEEKVTLLFHTQFLNAEKKERSIASLLVHCREGDVRLEARFFIDATGNGNVAVSCGADVVAHHSPVSYRFVMTNVDTNALIEYFQKNPHEFSNGGTNNERRHLSVKGFSSLTKMWRDESPELSAFDSIELDGTIRTGEIIVSMIHLPVVSAEDVESLTKAELRCQQLAPRAAEFLVRRCPGFSSARILVTPPQFGFHSVRQVCGKITITDTDVMSERSFSNVMATCAVPGRMKAVFQIPREAMVPPAVDNLIVTGRAIFPPTALFSTNNQPASMRLGEAAGALAAERIHDKSN